VSVEQYWTDIDREKPKNADKILSQCHFVHHKHHWIDLGANPGGRDNVKVLSVL
jgi:hypothetical protein